MARPKKQVKLKEPIKIRLKSLADGNKSIYLDIYYKGVRKYEYLKLYLVPEINPICKEQNKQTMAVAERIKDYYALSWDIKNVNTQRGRTKEDFAAKGKILYEAVKNNGYGLTLEECIECVRFRVICETWNGIILRENNTVATLQRMFPNLKFVKAEGEMDHTYAVDFQVYKNDELVCAIQIKPKSYLQNAPYIVKARQANSNKYAAYNAKFGVSVLTVISTSKGEIQNKEVLTQIRDLI